MASDEELTNLAELLAELEGPERIEWFARVVGFLLSAAADLHRAITNGGTSKREFVKLGRRLEDWRPSALLNEGQATVGFMLVRRAKVLYWPGTGYATSAHEAAVVSAYALLRHIREAAGLPDTGPINWQAINLNRVRKHLASWPPFNVVPRLMAEMRIEAAVAHREWQAESQDAEQEERLVFDDDTRTITLDGQVYRELEPVPYAILKAAWNARPLPVRGTDLKGLPGLKGKNIARELRKLPQPLQGIIWGTPGSGRSIVLPPRNCL